MKVIRWMEKETVKENIIMKMDLCMKDNGNRIECVVMEKYIINQEI